MDEPQLNYRKISIIDGNTSLRRVDRHQSACKQTFQCDYFLPVDKVNEIEMPGASHQGDGFDEAIPDGNVDQCVRNWRAALPDNLKSMFSKFDETGIFAAVCRHGFILTCVDMVRSGELSKYPRRARFYKRRI